MFEGISLVQLTPAGLLLIAVFMVLTGRLVPRSTYLDKAQEATEWRKAYELERSARATTDAQTRELLEVAKTNVKFLEAVHEQSATLKSGDA